ncbi:MAG: TlpA family protein disulfide reductase [Gammaproteobacteria bacterium]|nr:TlpA family protein disulfide reductase [Gammaproteobacteria bacterium]
MTGTQHHSRAFRLAAGRRRLAVSLVAAMACMMGLAQAADPASPVTAPDFVLKSTAGPNIRLSEYRSEVVALAFVASWCGACRESLPQWQGLQQEFGAEGLRFITVSFDTRPEAAAGMAGSAGGAFPMLLDPAGETGRLYAIGRLPALVLVDREGRLRSQYRDGRLAPGNEIRREIRRLLDE